MLAFTVVTGSCPDGKKTGIWVAENLCHDSEAINADIVFLGTAPTPLKAPAANHPHTLCIHFSVCKLRWCPHPAEAAHGVDTDTDTPSAPAPPFPSYPSPNMDLEEDTSNQVIIVGFFHLAMVYHPPVWGSFLNVCCFIHS